MLRNFSRIAGAFDDDSIKNRDFGARRIALAYDGRLLNTIGTAACYFIDLTTFLFQILKKSFSLREFQNQDMEILLEEL